MNNIDKIRKKYPVGIMVKLHRLSSDSSYPDGLTGYIKRVDNNGLIHVIWSNNKEFPIDEEKDSFEIVENDIDISNGLFEKNMSFEVSKKFFDILEDKLNKLNPTFNGYYNVFNNCREQGLQLIVYGGNDPDDDLCIWSCMCRNSDQIMVVIGDRTCSDVNNMFDDKAYKCARYFRCNDYDNASDYALNVIKKNFPKYLNQSYNYKFNCNRSISDIERIVNDAKDLDYEDYHDLATFEDDNYFCDLIILDGKVGLRYSKFLDEYHDEYENIHFEEYTPDLTSEVTLMLGMKQKLGNFIDEEIDYDITYGNIGI